MEGITTIVLTNGFHFQSSQSNSPQEERNEEATETVTAKRYFLRLGKGSNPLGSNYDYDDDDEDENEEGKSSGDEWSTNKAGKEAEDDEGNEESGPEPLIVAPEVVMFDTAQILMDQLYRRNDKLRDIITKYAMGHHTLN